MRRALSRLAALPLVASLATGSLTALAPSPAGAQAPAQRSAIERADAGAPPEELTRRANDSGGARYAPWPYLLGGAGVVFLAASLATGLTANARQNELERECDGNICPASLKSTRDSARTLATFTDVFWITGVTTGVGVTLFVLDATRESSTSVLAGCFGAGCGVLANGTF